MLIPGKNTCGREKVRIRFGRVRFVLRRTSIAM